MFKTERFEMRLTVKEAQLLDQVRGSATRAAWIRNQIARAAGVSTDTPVESTLTEQPIMTNPNRHLHRRGDLVDTRFVRGTQVRTYLCAEPGCTQQMEA